MRRSLPAFHGTDDLDAPVMDDCPNVISLGKRCQLHGYEFRGLPHSNTPYLIKLDGEIIYLDVRDHVPYMDSHAPAYRITARESPQTPPVRAIPAKSKKPKVVVYQLGGDGAPGSFHEEVDEPADLNRPYWIGSRPA